MYKSFPPAVNCLRRICSKLVDFTGDFEKAEHGRCCQMKRQTDDIKQSGNYEINDIKQSGKYEIK